MNDTRELAKPVVAPELAGEPRWKTLALPACAALIVTLAYLLPQIAYTTRGNQGALLVQEDEDLYVTRLVRALQGLPAMSPLVYEHRNDISVVSGFAERALAAPFRLGAAVGLPVPDANSVVVFYRALFTFAGVLAMVFAFLSAGLSRPVAVLASGWAYLDAGVPAYKPILGLLWTTHALNRFTNPLVGLPIFLFAWACLARAYFQREQRVGWIVASGISTGALFYINFYYWTLSLAIAGLTALFDLRRRWLLVAAMGGIAASLAIGYFRYAFEFRAHPMYTDILWRTDFLSNGRGVSFMPNKTLWVFVLCAFSVWRLRTPETRFLVASIAAGLICMYSGLATGLATPNSLQNGHWVYGVAPMVVSACLASAHAWLAQSRFARFERALYAVLALALAVGGVSTMWRVSNALQTSVNGAGTLSRAYDPAWKWLRENTPTDVVVLASEPTLAHQVLKAGKYIWGHYHVYPDPVSFEEILERYRVLWWFEGATARELEAKFASQYAGPNTWFWGYGLTPELARELRADGYPPLEVLRWRLFSKTVVDLVAGTRAADITSIGRRYRVDYVVRGPNERRWRNTEALLDMTPVFETPEVRIDRVRGWR